VVQVENALRKYDKRQEKGKVGKGAWVLGHGSMATGFEIQAQLMFIDMGTSGKVVGLAVLVSCTRSMINTA
jgi:hypothetical protein